MDNQIEVELVASPVKGYRLFRVDFERIELKSLTFMGRFGNGDNVWLPQEVMKSSCGVTSPHHRDEVKPAKNCTCGLWAATSRSTLLKTFPTLAAEVIRWGRKPDLVSAQILQWGTVIQHEWGYRSEFAQIIPETIAWYPRLPYRYKKPFLTYLREKYGA